MKRKEIIDAEHFNFSKLAQYGIIERNKRKKGSKSILNCVCAFDIEASRIKEIEQAVMYIWQFQFDDITVIGRTWEEFFMFLEKISDHLHGICWLVVYVHNLSYEFQFLKGLYDFQPEEVFVTDPRTILKCTMFDCIEFRCSYMLTNMSLDKFLKQYNVENKKLDYDYDKVRYPYTELTAEELAYCVNDVKGLVQGIKEQLRAYGDDLATIPLTSTGYVRRDVKQAMRNYNHKQLDQMKPTVKVYKALREAFRGGDTLSNRWRTDEIISNIRSCDIVSSYPASMMLKEYPMSRFVLEDPKRFDEIYTRYHRAMLFKVIFIGIELASNWQGHAYLSRDKCRDIENGVYANGRILYADYLETTITDIDYEIICRRYKWKEKHVFKLWCSNYGKLPLQFRNVIMKYYRAKTVLKGAEYGTDDYIYYCNNKAQLNALYGLTVQKISDSIIFKDGEYMQENKPLAELVAQHNRRTSLCYQWGCWVTCWSRKRLADGIDVVTKNDTEPLNFIYSDTDSIKYEGNADFTEFNAKAEQEAMQCGAVAFDRNGEAHYMGVFEDEGYATENRFITMGAKKYVVEEYGKLHTTIAGVNKSKGGEELGKIENFKDGFVFREAGGTESVYNDNIDMYYNTPDGMQVHITDNVVIRPSEYTLGITAEYREVLDGLAEIKYSDHDIAGLYKVKN